MAEQKIKIVVDLNRITRREYRRWLDELRGADDGEGRDILTGNLIEKVVTDWPFSQAINADGYMSLGLADSQWVDRELTKALGDDAQKN